MITRFLELLLLLGATAAAQTTFFPPPPQLCTYPVLKAMQSIEVMTYVSGYEHAFEITPSGLHYFYGGAPHSVKVPLSPDAEALVHAHRREDSPRPSPIDIQTARDSGRPMYVVTRTELWVAEPDGTVWQTLDWRSLEKMACLK